MENKIKGTVKWFGGKNVKGYGFIESDGVDYFVNWKNIISGEEGGYKTLKTGQKVIFSVDKSERGLSAINVVVE